MSSSSWLEVFRSEWPSLLRIVIPVVPTQACNIAMSEFIIIYGLTKINNYERQRTSFSILHGMAHPRSEHRNPELFRFENLL